MSRTQYDISPRVVALVHDERWIDGDDRSDEQVFEPIAQEMYDACAAIAEKHNDTAKGIEVMML